MTGSLQEKNGYYYVLLNKKTKEGKRKVEWVATGLEVKGNKRRAEQFRLDLLKEETLREGLNSTAAEELFADYIRQWLQTAQIRLDPVTYEGYRQLAEIRVIPYFEEKGLRVKDIERKDIQDFVNHLATCKRLDGRKKQGLSPKTIRDYMVVVNQSLETAVLDNLILVNPCQYVKLPKKQPIETDYYNEKELRQLFDAIRDDPIYPLVYFTVLYGLRRSEVIGLQWDSVDFEEGIVTIKHTVVDQSGIYKKDTTKNKSSHRSYPMTDEVRKILIEIKEQEELNRKEYGKKYKESPYIFKWPDGSDYKPNYVTNHFRKLLDENGLRHIRFHDLRHSCATYLISQGYNLKFVSEWLGHADIKVTADIYGHIDAEHKRQVAETMSESFKF